MVIVTHATCKSKESLRQYYGIREGFTDSQGQQQKTKKKERNYIFVQFLSCDMFAPMMV